MFATDIDPNASSPILRAQRRRHGRHTVIWLDGTSSPTVDRLLASAMTDRHVRLMVCSPQFGTLEALRRWSEGLTDPDWAPDDRGHYMQGGNTFALRYRHRSGRTAEIRPATEWFSHDLGHHDAADAYGLMADMIETPKGWLGAELLASPAATGRDLIRRSIPASAEWEPPPPHIAAEIRHNSGQGRNQLFTDAGPEGTHYSVYELDMRLAYLALCRELPGNYLSSGLPRSGDLDWAKESQQRARWHVRIEPPRGWRHLGLAPVKDGETGWQWPTDGPVVTWLDGVELHLAISQGWRVTKIYDRMLFSRGRPLDGWASRLLSLIDRCETPEIRRRYSEPVAAAAARGWRMVALAAIGSLHSTGAMVDRSAPLEVGREALPVEAEHIRLLDGRWHWQERQQVREPEFQMPHWSAAIWARARTRLLSGPQGTGALHLPADRIVALRTDAIYATLDPRWPDRGIAGDWRIKSVRHDQPWPQTVTQLLAGR